MKELTLEDFNLTPEELARLVAGAQRHFPARDDDGNLSDTNPDEDQNTVNNSDIQPTS
jgi:hypothetical protein